MFQMFEKNDIFPYFISSQFIVRKPNFFKKQSPN